MESGKAVQEMLGGAAQLNCSLNRLSYQWRRSIFRRRTAVNGCTLSNPGKQTSLAIRRLKSYFSTELPPYLGIGLVDPKSFIYKAATVMFTRGLRHVLNAASSLFPRQ
jgi:hypothetical protein